MLPEGHLSKIFKWYESTNAWLKAFVKSIVIVLPSYGTAILAYYVREGLDARRVIGTYSLLTLILLTLFFLVIRYIDLRAAEARQISENRRRAIGQAHIFADELVARYCELVREGIHDLNVKKDGTPLFEAVISSVRNIRMIVERLYLVMESQYSKAEDYLNQISFEVTFMTKSYKDGKITIIAWRNRDRRGPRSMIQREQNPEIYSQTVTAKVYSADRPEMVIVEDTSNPEVKYHNVYQGQKERIKSSAVYPVLADNNDLLGTLVVHCDKVGFFKESDRAFWATLFEIFSKRIAYQKLCLDTFREMDPKQWIELTKHSSLFDF